jgi:large subunit ribosomal protein L35
MKIKIKTKKSAQKRFKLTKNGKVKRNKAFANHMLTKKSQERKRKYRKSVVVSPANSKNIKKMIPYA